MKKTLLQLFILAIIFTTSCSKKPYISDDFDQIAQSHKTMAIMPFEMTVNHKVYKDLTQEQVSKALESESIIFTSAYQTQLKDRAVKSKKNIRIKILDSKKVLAILDENNLTLTETWAMDAAKLAQLLSVDAVLRGTIRKERFFSDELSFAIELGQVIVRESIPELIGVPGYSSLTRRSKEIDATYEIFDANMDYSIWTLHFECPADWRSPTSEIIENVNYKSTKKFPYLKDK